MCPSPAALTGTDEKHKDMLLHVKDFLCRLNDADDGADIPNSIKWKNSRFIE